MGAGDVCLLKYAEICDLYRRYSRNASRSGKGIIDTVNRTTKTSRKGISRVEFGNIGEDFKTNIIISLSSHFYALMVKKRKEEKDRSLAIFSLDAEKGIPSRDSH